MRKSKIISEKYFHQGYSLLNLKIAENTAMRHPRGILPPKYLSQCGHVHKSTRQTFNHRNYLNWSLCLQISYRCANNSRSYRWIVLLRSKGETSACARESQRILRERISVCTFYSRLSRVSRFAELARRATTKKLYRISEETKTKKLPPSHVIFPIRLFKLSNENK